MCHINQLIYETSSQYRYVSLDYSTSAEFSPPAYGYLISVYYSRSPIIISDTAQDTCPGGALGQAEVSCVRQSESCNVYESCETRETFLGCSSYFLCTGQPATPVCPAGFVFVARLNQCLSLYSSRDEIGQPAGKISSCWFSLVVRMNQCLTHFFQPVMKLVNLLVHFLSSLFCLHARMNTCLALFSIHDEIDEFVFEIYTMSFFGCCTQACIIAPPSIYD